MNTIQTFRLVSLFAASSIVLCATGANAASFTIGSTTVNGSDVFSGPTFVVTDNFLGTDTISLSATGTVDLSNTNASGYNTNAAGVLTQPGTLGTTGDTLLDTSSGFNYGALLIGNSTLGFKQIFAANAANGLNSSAPSNIVSLSNLSLSSLFGSGLTSGTVLGFLVSDSNNNDNSGSFTVTGSIDSAASVPEPFTIIGTLIGGTTALRMKKKLEADKK
jgi:hypothetical protein